MATPHSRLTADWESYWLQVSKAVHPGILSLGLAENAEATTIRNTVKFHTRVFWRYPQCHSPQHAAWEEDLVLQLVAGAVP